MKWKQKKAEILILEVALKKLRREMFLLLPFCCGWTFFDGYFLYLLFFIPNIFLPLTCTKHFKWAFFKTETFITKQLVSAFLKQKCSSFVCLPWSLAIVPSVSRISSLWFSISSGDSVCRMHSKTRGYISL